MSRISQYGTYETHKLFDRELVLSKNIPEDDIITGLSRFGSFKIFYDPFQYISYIKLNKSNENYYSILKYISSLGLHIDELAGQQVLVLSQSGNHEMEFLKNISMIRGVMRYPFSLMFNRKLFFRFLLLEESLADFTEIAMDFLEKNEDWEIVHLKEPDSLGSFLKKFNYEKSVKSYIFKEEDFISTKENFPHYSCSHIFYLLLGEPNEETERSIRFSDCDTGVGGIIKKSTLLRNSEIRIYEDLRKITDISFVNIVKNPIYTIPLEVIQSYDGNEVLIKIVIDQDDEKTLFTRLREYNIKQGDKVKFYIKETSELV